MTSDFDTFIIWAVVLVVHVLVRLADIMDSRLDHVCCF